MIHEVYHDLSRVFSTPTEAYVLKNRIFEVLQKLDSSLVRIPLAPLREELLAVDDEILRVEYARLFYGPGRAPAPLYESIYREGRLMGNTTREVYEIYLSAGLYLSKSYLELPDHLSVELDFIYLLGEAEMRAEKREVGEETEEETEFIYELRSFFLKEHLLQWAPLLLKRLKESSYHSIFLPLLEILLEVMEADSKVSLYKRSCEGDALPFSLIDSP